MSDSTFENTFSIDKLSGANKGLLKLYDVIKADSGYVTNANFNRTSGQINLQDNLKFLSGNFELLKNSNTSESETGSVIELAGRAYESFIRRETTRQFNRDKVTSIAAEQLAAESEIADEPVDPDWRTRFFRHVEDVSNEEIQMIWGKILAGEIQKPNTYSFRTLETLKNLTREEAELFTSYSSKVIWQRGQFAILPKLINGTTIPLTNVAKLTDAGLLASGESLSFTLKHNGTSAQRVILQSYGWLIEATTELHNPEFSFDIILLTTAGEQICKLINAGPDIPYLSELATQIKQTGRVVRFGEILNEDTNGIINFRIQPGFEI